MKIFATTSRQHRPLASKDSEGEMHDRSTGIGTPLDRIITGPPASAIHKSRFWILGRDRTGQGMDQAMPGRHRVLQSTRRRIHAFGGTIRL